MPPSGADRLGLVIDIKLLRDQPDAVRASQRARGEDEGIVDAILTADERRRSSIADFEALRAEQKSYGKRVAAAKGDQKAALVAAAKATSDRVKELQAAADVADAELGVGDVGGGLQLLDPVGGGLCRCDQRRLLVALGRCDTLAVRLLLGPKRLEIGDGRPTSLVRRQDRVNDPFVLTTGTLCRPHGVGLVAQKL